MNAILWAHASLSEIGKSSSIWALSSNISKTYVYSPWVIYLQLRIDKYLASEKLTWFYAKLLLIFFSTNMRNEGNWLLSLLVFAFLALRGSAIMVSLLVERFLFFNISGFKIYEMYWYLHMTAILLFSILVFYIFTVIFWKI